MKESSGVDFVSFVSLMLDMVTVCKFVESLAGYQFKVIFERIVFQGYLNKSDYEVVFWFKQVMES
jgi:hypothetical protein